MKTIPIIDCSVSSTLVESFRIKRVAGTTEKMDENAGSRWATMIVISEAAADHHQNCELCQTITSHDDNILLTLMTVL